jgi:hypothetical protein
MAGRIAASPVLTSFSTTTPAADRVGREIMAIAGCIFR